MGPIWYPQIPQKGNVLTLDTSSGDDFMTATSKFKYSTKKEKR